MVWHSNGYTDGGDPSFIGERPWNALDPLRAKVYPAQAGRGKPEGIWLHMDVRLSWIWYMPKHAQYNTVDKYIPAPSNRLS